jgi:hypothetical protein
MKKRKGIGFVFFPFILTFCLYLVFYSTVESKPTDAGFWLILVMGMSIGVALSRFIQWMDNKKQNNK